MRALQPARGPAVTRLQRRRIFRARSCRRAFEVRGLCVRCGPALRGAVDRRACGAAHRPTVVPCCRRFTTAPLPGCCRCPRARAFRHSRHVGTSEDQVGPGVWAEAARRRCRTLQGGQGRHQVERAAAAPRGAGRAACEGALLGSAASCSRGAEPVGRGRRKQQWLLWLLCVRGCCVVVDRWYAEVGGALRITRLRASPARFRCMAARV